MTLHIRHLLIEKACRKSKYDTEDFMKKIAYNYCHDVRYLRKLASDDKDPLTSYYDKMLKDDLSGEEGRYFSNGNG